MFHQLLQSRVVKIPFELLKSVKAINQQGKYQTNDQQFAWNVPGKLYVKHYVRRKYKVPVDGKIIIADPVCEPIAKCEADVSLINFIMVSKFVYH